MAILFFIMASISVVQYYQFQTVTFQDLRDLGSASYSILILNRSPFTNGILTTQGLSVCLTTSSWFLCKESALLRHSYSRSLYRQTPSPFTYLLKYHLPGEVFPVELIQNSSPCLLPLQSFYFIILFFTHSTQHSLNLFIYLPPYYLILQL